MATLYLADDDDSIRKKIMKARTDGGPTKNNSIKPHYIDNLFVLMKLVSKKEVINKYEEAFNNCVIRYGDMKKQLAEDMVNFISPIRKRVNEILADEKYLEDVMKKGAGKATANAEVTMKLARKAIGLNYY